MYLTQPGAKGKIIMMMMAGSCGARLRVRVRLWVFCATGALSWGTGWIRSAEAQERRLPVGVYSGAFLLGRLVLRGDRRSAWGPRREAARGEGGAGLRAEPKAERAAESDFLDWRETWPSLLTAGSGNREVFLRCRGQTGWLWGPPWWWSHHHL